MLLGRGFALVVETETHADGWRAEFLGSGSQNEVVLLAHKPSCAPFVTLDVTVALNHFDSTLDCAKLMDQTSDFDVSVYLSESQDNLIHLTSRLLISGINEADLDFTLNNLLICREAVLNGDEDVAVQ